MATIRSGRTMSAKALTALCALAIAIGASPSYSQPKDTGPATTAPAPTSQAAITPEQIEEAIKYLSAQSVTAAQSYTDLLWRAGQAAVPALEKAAKGEDIVRAARAKEILADIEWNLFPDTPKRVLNAIRQYRTADAQKKEQLLGEVFSRTGSIMPVINRIMSHETDETVREKIKELMIGNAASVAPEMIWNGDLDKAQAILEKAAMGGDAAAPMQAQEDSGEGGPFQPVEDDDESIDADPIRHYIAFLLLSNPDKLDAKIKELSSAASMDKRSATMLALAYRAKGDLPAALKVAKEHNVLLAELLFEAGDWKALAEHQESVAGKADPGAVGGDPEAMGRQLAFYRLCGKNEDAQKVVEKIIQAAAACNEGNEQNSNAWWAWPKQLLGSEDIDQAIKLLIQHPAGTGPAFALLVNQGRFAEALDIIDKATEQPKGEFQLMPRHSCLSLKLDGIRLRYRLGQKEEASKRIKAILTEPSWGSDAGSLPPDPNAEPNAPQLATRTLMPGVVHTEAPRQPVASIISLYVELGLKAEACALMEETFKDLTPDAQAQYISRARATDWLTPPLWWVAISRHTPKASVTERLKDLDQLLAGKLDLKELAALAEIAAQIPVNDAPSGYRMTEAQRATGVFRELLNYDNFPDTRKYFDLWLQQDDNDPTGGWGGPELEFAMQFMKHGKFAEAAALLHPATAKNAWAPIVAMEGNALVQAGQKEEGQRLLKLAGLMMLADEGVRARLAQHFVDFGQKEFAARQYELILRLSDPPGNSHSDDPIKFAYSQAMKKKEFAQAAKLAEILRISNLVDGSDWTRPEMFLAAMVQAHLPLAMEAKAKGDWEKYAAEITICQDALPLANSQPLIDAINDLTKAGKTVLADALFDRSWKLGVKTCQDWPGASDYFNSTAWLAVACHRKINETFNLAQQAVDLDKKSSANLDTLAEIYFQKGDRAKAVELCNKCMELDQAATKEAGNAKESKMANYLRLQLKRLQTMDPSTPTPQLDNDEQ